MFEDLKDLYKVLIESSIGADYPDTPKGREILARHHKFVYSAIGKAKDKFTKERLYLLGRKLGMDLHRSNTGDIEFRFPGGEEKVTRVKAGSVPENPTIAGILQSALSRGVRIPNQPVQVSGQMDAYLKLRGVPYTGPRATRAKARDKK